MRTCGSPINYITFASNLEVVHEALTRVDDINKLYDDDFTLLDGVYYHSESPIKQEIIDLIRSKGGKANYYDADGRDVGVGNGDLNVERHAVMTGW